MDPDETQIEETSPDDAIDAIVARHAAETAPNGSQEAAEAPDDAQPQDEPPAASQPETSAETPPPAPAAAPPPAPAPEPSAQGRNLAILAERQRAIGAERERLQQERAAFAAERESLERDLNQFRAFRTKLERQDALGALKEVGVDLNALNRAALEGRGTNPTSQLEEQMTQRLTETERRLQERLDALQRAEHQRLERAFFDEARGEAARVSPLVASMGDTGLQAIYARYQAHAHAHQGEQLPSYEDVIREVEREALDFIRPLLETETVRGLIPRQPQDASPTLSNRQAAAAPTRTQEPEPPSYFDPYDDNESVIDALVRKHHAAR